MLNLKPIVHRILEDLRLPPTGTHGVGHWARVLENGLRLAERTVDKVQVVQLFAVFHDSRRINEGVDPGHGKHGAEQAALLRGDLFDLADDDFALLYDACVWHTDGLTEGHLTIQTCWDADRLDLAGLEYLRTRDGFARQRQDGRTFWNGQMVGERSRLCRESSGRVGH